MKNIPLILFILSVLMPLRASEHIKNGDFKDGSEGWQGDIESVGQSDPDSTSIAASSGATSTPGLVIHLKKESWTTTHQNFDSRGGVNLSITLSFSQGTSFSDKIDDYMNVNRAIGFDAWAPFRLNRGEWMIVLSDLEGTSGVTGGYFPIMARFDSANALTFRHTIANFPYEMSTKTLTIAFPPGEGTVTITNVSAKGIQD